jgi:hypothetical protein
MLSMLGCSESSQTDGHPDALLGRLDDQLEIQLLLSCKLRRFSQESGNCFLDAWYTDTCHIKDFP